MNTKVSTYIKALRYDIPSSIVVFLVALPLCLGVALASNAPPFSGIIAGIVGAIVIGFASKSHLSVSGPAAGLTTIVAAAIISLHSYEAFLVAVVICGILQICMGFLKAGVVGDYIPNGVIKGMLAAIGIILLLNQFPHLLGDDSQFETDEMVPQHKGNIFSNFINAFSNISPAAMQIGVVCLVFYFLWERFVATRSGFIKSIPAPLLIVFLAIGMNYLFAYSSTGLELKESHLLQIPIASSASEFFSFFSMPDWSQLMNSTVLAAGITLALAASLETLVSIEAVDDLDPYQRVTPNNRELKAQGLGNIVSGLIGGLPITSVIVRSSANVTSGAKTKQSTIIHGLLLLLTVAFIPAILNLIPKAALAAILIYIGYKLARPSLFISFYKKGWAQFLPFVITIFAILFTDLLQGIVIGIAVGLFFVIRSNFKTAVFVINDENKYLFRLRKDVSFLNKPILKDQLEKIPSNSSVLIDASRADFIDKDVIETIEDFMLHAPLKNIYVELKRNTTREQGFSSEIVSLRNKYIKPAGIPVQKTTKSETI